MKIKLLIITAFTILLLVGCAQQPVKTAKQHGKGISIEMGDSLNIKQMSLSKYVNGQEVFSENVVYADSSAFEKGDVIWFDAPPTAKDATIKIALSYSENIDGTDSNTTQKIDVSEADKWIHVQLTKDHELEMIEMD